MVLRCTYGGTRCSRGGIVGVMGSTVVLGVVEGGLWVLRDPRWY